MMKTGTGNTGNGKIVGHCSRNPQKLRTSRVRSVPLVVMFRGSPANSTGLLQRGMSELTELHQSPCLIALFAVRNTPARYAEIRAAVEDSQCDLEWAHVGSLHKAASNAPERTNQGALMNHSADHRDEDCDRNTAQTAEHPVSAAARETRVGFLILGVVLIALGMAAIVFPLAATFAIDSLIGAILVLSGAVQTVHAFGAGQWKGFFLSLLGGVLALTMGVILLVYPFAGILSLTLLTAAFLAASGVLRMVLALQLRPADNWAWLLGSGMLALMLAAVILPQWPQGAAWLFGLLIGMDLLFAGWASIMLVGAARRLTSRACSNYRSEGYRRVETSA